MEAKFRDRSIGVIVIGLVTSGAYCAEVRAREPVPVNVCGQNAAYVMLKLLGHDVDYASVGLQLPDVKEGVSLKELRRALLALGLKATVVQISPTDLPDTPLPCIVWLRPGYLHGDLGHYVVITGASEEGVTIINAQNAERKHWPWRFLSDAWTGYAIVPTIDNRTSYVQMICVGTSAFLLFAVILRYRRSLGKLATPAQR
jgi:ABC-type bacteriocin/lantibiotic exporter with double-glycine peptidase domain